MEILELFCILVLEGCLFFRVGVKEIGWAWGGFIIVVIRSEFLDLFYYVLEK